MLYYPEMILKEHMHSSREFFSCGYKNCVKTFETGVGYIYHLNSAHEYKIDTFAKAKSFLVELHKRLDSKVLKRASMLNPNGLFTKKSLRSKSR